MKVKDGKLKLSKNERQVGSFVFKREAEHIKVTDINGAMSFRISNRAFQSGRLLEMMLQEKEQRFLHNYAAMVWNLSGVIPDEAFMLDVNAACVNCVNRHKEFYGIKENISVRRFVIVDGVTSTYIHGFGGTGVIVKFCTDVADKDGFAEYAKNIALQIAAGNPPQYVNIEDVPAEAVAEEKAVLIAQMKNDPKNANKPDAILDKIVSGRLGKFYERVCLVEQGYVKEDSMTVGTYTKNTAKELGGDIKICSFVLFEKGEGIEKVEEDYAAEIARLSGVKQ